MSRNLSWTGFGRGKAPDINSAVKQGITGRHESRRSLPVRYRCAKPCKGNEQKPLLDAQAGIG